MHKILDSHVAEGPGVSSGSSNCWGPSPLCGVVTEMPGPRQEQLSPRELVRPSVLWPEVGKRGEPAAGVMALKGQVLVGQCQSLL